MKRGLIYTEEGTNASRQLIKYQLETARRAPCPSLPGVTGLSLPRSSLGRTHLGKEKDAVYAKMPAGGVGSRQRQKGGGKGSNLTRGLWVRLSPFRKEERVRSINRRGLSSWIRERRVKKKGPQGN